MFRPRRVPFVIFMVVLPKTLEDVTSPKRRATYSFVCVMSGSCDLRIPALVFATFEEMETLIVSGCEFFFACVRIFRSLSHSDLPERKAVRHRWKDRPGSSYKTPSSFEMKWLPHIRSHSPCSRPSSRSSPWLFPVPPSSAQLHASSRSPHHRRYIYLPSLPLTAGSFPHVLSL